MSSIRLFYQFDGRAAIAGLALIGRDSYIGG